MPKTPPTPGQTKTVHVSELQYEPKARTLLDDLAKFRTRGPVPTVLPAADLKALGLDARALVYAAPDPGRAQIELGTPTGAAVV
jgi:hypothetical protein